MACLARNLCTPKLETLVDPLSTFAFKVFFLLFPSALTPNNFRTEGSLKKSIFSSLSFLLVPFSGSPIQIRDGWVQSPNASNVLCRPRVPLSVRYLSV